MLAVTAVSLVTGYLSRNRDELVDRVGDAVVDRLGSLYRWVRDRLRHEPTASAALDALEQAPQDARRQGAVEFALTQLMETNTDLAEELTALLNEIEDGGRMTATQITDAGAVAISGDVRMKGTYVAGRDLTVSMHPPRPDEIPPAPAPDSGRE